MAAFGFAKIDAAGEFADAEDIEAIGDEFLFDGRGMGQGRQADAGPEVGEQAEVLAQRQQRAAFRLEVRRQRLPLRATYRAEQNRRRGFASSHRRRWQRMPGGVDRGPADQVMAAGDGKSELGGGGVEDAQGLGHDFGANAVAGENRDAVGA